MAKEYLKIFLFHLISFAVQETFSQMCLVATKNTTLILSGTRNCTYEVKNCGLCSLNITSRNNGSLTFSSNENDIYLKANESKIYTIKKPLRRFNLRFSRNETFNVEILQNYCPCIKTKNITGIQSMNGKSTCISFEKNSSLYCNLHIKITGGSCNGSLIINETQTLQGCIQGHRKLELGNGTRLIFYNYTGSLSWNQARCKNQINLIQDNLNLLQLQDNRQEQNCCYRTYFGDSFVFSSNRVTSPSGCTARIIRSRSTVCRLRLIFIWFDMGQGYLGRCYGGFLDVDGFRFCGCQSSLYWTTGIYTFTGEEAIIRYYNNYNGKGFTIQVTQEDCFLPQRRQKRFIESSGQCLAMNSVTMSNSPAPVTVDECQEKVQDCFMLPKNEKILQSPGYPRPSERDVCYKFPEGECGVTLTFDDFDLQLSRGCVSDFVIIDDKKYCGNELFGKQVKLIKPELKLHQTSSPNRGFSLKYTIKCTEMTTESNTEAPDDPSGRLGPCEKVYSNRQGRVASQTAEPCVYTIKKQDKDVCSLEIQISDMDIFCGKESLLLDKQYYCGRILRESFNIPFKEEKLKVEHLVTTPGIGSGKFELKWIQKRCSFQANGNDERIKSCESQIKERQGVVIAPSLFPRPPEDLACSYQFYKFKDTCSLKLDFIYFDIEISNNCSENFFKIANKKYCGSGLSNTTKVLDLVESFPLEIQYKIGKDTPFFDWKFKYSHLPCKTGKQS